MFAGIVVARFCVKTRVEFKKKYYNHWVGIGEETISKRLKQLGMIEKEGYWLLEKQTLKGFLQHIVTGDKRELLQLEVINSYIFDGDGIMVLPLRTRTGNGGDSNVPVLSIVLQSILPGTTGIDPRARTGLFLCPGATTGYSNMNSSNATGTNIQATPPLSLFSPGTGSIEQGIQMQHAFIFSSSSLPPPLPFPPLPYPPLPPSLLLPVFAISLRYAKKVFSIGSFSLTHQLSTSVN
nr:hypothetical protein HmN_000036200 [Hymenolepis microstoma]